MPKCVLCYLLLFVFSVVSASSELKVVARSACRIVPGPAEARIACGVEFGLAMAANNFAAGGSGNACNGYILKHSRGIGNNPLSVPALGDPAGRNFFRGNDAGLHTMYLTNGLTCDNCTVTRAGETTSVIGTATNPALILIGQGTFTGVISLNGDCTFTLRGLGNYNLACGITGNGSLTYDIVDANGAGLNAGITLSGTTSNDYTGSTAIRNGFIVCNKQNGTAAVVAIPHNIIVAAAVPDKPARIWCQNHNQFGTGAVIDFRGAAYFSYIDLNGTSQTVAGIQASNSYAVAENNWDRVTFPAGMTSAQINAHSATLNIAGGETPCTFGGGGYLRNGFNGTSNGQPFASPELTVNVTSGTQIIQNPSGNINNVTLASEGEGVLEFNGNGDHSFGGGVTFKGSGIIKKTGTGTIKTNNSTLLKSGTILVSEGTLRNDMDYNVYVAAGNGSNTAILQVEAPTAGGGAPVFDIWGNASVFGGLTGGGVVQNGWGSMAGSLPGGGYSWLTIGQGGTKDSANTFAGVIRDNSANGTVSTNGAGTGGIAFKKVGMGTQVLTGANRYMGSTLVSSGTLKLEEAGRLGGGNYGGVLHISNVPSGTPAVFEHNGNSSQVFAGDIVSANATDAIRGIFLQSGVGSTIINGVKTFAGNVRVTGGFLGGSGDLSKAGSVRVEAGGSIGGGTRAANGGGTLVVSNLNFAAASSKLTVTARTTDHTLPSLVEVKTGTGAAGAVTAAHNFTVDILGDSQFSGYILKCSNGSNLPLPALGERPAGRNFSFRWDAAGLYMDFEGLTCDNCTVTPEGRAAIEGSTANPALILGAPGTFRGAIRLNGPCNFTLRGTGNYNLACGITGNGPLTYNIPGADASGHNAGITLSGETSNTYSGLTTIRRGYITCNKSQGVVAVPRDILVSGVDGTAAHIWCLSDNQFGTETVIDFRGAAYVSYIHLNGTSQTVDGIQANNNNAVAENNWDKVTFPAGMTSAQISVHSATLNIAGGETSCTFGGGGYLRNGFNGTSNGQPFASPPLTVNVTSGTQIIQNPSGNINNVTLASEGEGVLEFNGNGAHSFGEGVTFKGSGIIKKTGTGTIATNNSTFLKSGTIQVLNGTLRNHGTGVYATADGINTAALRVEASTAGNNPIFDIWGNASVFGGLTGNGVVQNGWGSMAGSPPGGGYSWLTIGQGGAQNSTAVFDGVIRDNAANGTVSAGGAGRGGIALKKEGAGTQVLTGANTYTGPTSVSSGTLKLQGGGQIGTVSPSADEHVRKSARGTYGGALDISNAASGNPAVFEHNGGRTQVFAGDIVNTGEGAIRGVFLQSGIGSTIVTGAKSFAGNVRITGGFLGGKGSLSAARSVRAEAGGSIGGGIGERPHGGGTLVVSNLHFAAASAKLIVTTLSPTDGSPSVLDVRAINSTVSGSGSVTVTAAGFTVDVVGGANQASGYIIKCSNGVSDNLPTPALGDNDTGKAVCFRWDNAGLWMQVGDWAISHGNADLSKLCPDIPVRIEPAPAGAWEVSDLGAATNVIGSAVTATGGVASLLPGRATGGVAAAQQIRVRAGSCLSVPIRITVHPKPVMNAIPERVFCGNYPAPAFTPVSEGTGESVPLYFKWKIEGNPVNQGNVGLPDHAADWSKTEVSGFTSASTAAVIKRDITITGANAAGCLTEPRVLTVTINPNPVITPGTPKICANAGGITPQSVVLESNIAPAADNPWTIADGGDFGTILISPGNGRRATVTAVDRNQTAAQTVTVRFTSELECKADVAVSVSPRTFLSGLKASKLCESDHGVNENVVLEAQYATPHGYGVNTASGHWIFSNPGIAVNSAAPVSAVTSATQMRASFPGAAGSSAVRYADSGTGCAANESVTIVIESLEPPAAASPVVYCQHGAAAPLTVNNLPGAYKWWAPGGAGPTDAAPVPSTALQGDFDYKVSTVKTYPALAASAANTAAEGYLCASRQAVIRVSVGPALVLSANADADLTKLCSGAVYNGLLSKSPSSPSDEWLITDNSIVTSVTAVNGKNSLKAGDASGDAAIVQEISFRSGNCTSNALRLTINPKPIVNMADVGLCAGETKGEITPVSGAGLRAATGYKWEQRGAENAEVGLPNSTGEWKSKIPVFTAPAEVTGELKRAMIIAPYNAVTACRGEDRSWTVVVNSKPAISVNPEAGFNLNELCAGARYPGVFRLDAGAPETGNWAVYDDNSSVPNAIGTVAEHSLPRSDRKGDLRTGNPVGAVQQGVKQDVVFISGASCKSNAVKITVLPAPALDLGEGDLPERNFCNGQIVPEWVPPTGEGIRKATAFKWQVRETNSTDVGLADHTGDWTKTALSGFTAGNQTRLMIFRGLTVTAYNHSTGCTAEKNMRINVHPNASIAPARGADLTRLCSGASYANVIAASGGEAGEWRVFRAGTDIRSHGSSVSSGRGLGNLLIAGNVSRKTNEEVVYMPDPNCISNRLPITVYPKPSMDAIPDMVYCANSLVPPFVPVSRGEDEAKSTNYQWTGGFGVGLGDHTADWTRTEVSGFLSNAAGQSAISIMGYNAVSRCKAEPKVFAVSLSSTLTLTPEFVSPVCSGTKTNILLKSSLSNTSYRWTASNRAGAQSQVEQTGTPLIEQTLTANGSASETVTYNVTGASGVCTGRADISIEVSPLQAGKPSVSGGGPHCVNPGDNRRQTNLIPSAAGASEWTYASSGDNNISGRTQQWTKGALPSVRDNLVLWGDKPASVYYVFRAFAGCLGLPSDAVEVRLHPVPEVSAEVSSSICGHSEARPAPAIALVSFPAGASYTWTADRTSAPDVTGYTEPSHEGAAAGVRNPTAARQAVADALSLPSAVAGVQTIEYRITPWHSGCSGRVVSTRVEVNPLPSVTLSNRGHCSGAVVLAEPLTGTHGANAFKWSGGGAAGLVDQTAYGPGLPGYTAPTVSEPLGPLQVMISAKNARGCEGIPSPFALSVSPKPTVALRVPSPVICSGPALENATSAKIEITPNFPGTKYTWRAVVVDNKLEGGGSRLSMFADEGGALEFPREEKREQEGGLSKKILASQGSDAQVVFSVKPVLTGCEGDASSASVRVLGDIVRGEIVNRKPAICNRSAVDIKAGAADDGYLYSWTISDPAENVEGYRPEPTPKTGSAISDYLTLKTNTRSGVTYSVTPSTARCVGETASHTIFVNPSPVLTVSPLTKGICSEEKAAFVLSASLSDAESRAMTYSWEVSDNTAGALASVGSSGAFEAQTLRNPSVTDLPVTYTFTAWYNTGDRAEHCPSQPVNAVYSVSSPASAGIHTVVPEKVCAGDPLALTASPKGLAYQWLKNGAPVVGETGNSFLVPTDHESSSSYAVIVKNSCAGDTSALKTVNVTADAYFADSPLPEKDREKFEAGVPVSFTYAGQFEAEYLWDFGDKHTANTQNASHTYLGQEADVPAPFLKVTKKGQRGCFKTFSLEFAKEKKKSFAEIDVYPVPTRDLLTITDEHEMSHIAVGDSGGRIVLSQAVNSREVLLSIGRLAPGIYTLTVTDSQQVRRMMICKD